MTTNGRLQHRMPDEFFLTVKQVSIGHQHTAADGAQTFGYTDHLRIKIADPLHLVIVILRVFADIIGALHNHEAVDALTLMFWYNAKYEPDQLVHFSGF